MGLFKRMNNLLTANFNELLDHCENPERMLKQAVREMESALGRALDGAARAIAHERLLSRQLDDSRREVERCGRRAVEAVARDDDAAARAVLRRKAEQARLLESLSEQLVAAETLSNRLRSHIAAMRLKLAEARRKLLDLTVRSRTAEARRRFAANLQTYDETTVDCTSKSNFERIENRIALKEAETEALLELLGERETGVLDAEIEDELLCLKSARAREGAKSAQLETV